MRESTVNPLLKTAYDQKLLEFFHKHGRKSEER